jgi:hypothetical protein
LVLKDDNGIPFQKNIVRPFLEAIAKTNVKWRGQSRANGIKGEWRKDKYSKNNLAINLLWS